MDVEIMSDGASIACTPHSALCHSLGMILCLILSAVASTSDSGMSCLSFVCFSSSNYLTVGHFRIV